MGRLKNIFLLLWICKDKLKNIKESRRRAHRRRDSFVTVGRQRAVQGTPLTILFCLHKGAVCATARIGFQEQAAIGRRGNIVNEPAAVKVSVGVNQR